MMSVPVRKLLLPLLAAGLVLAGCATSGVKKDRAYIARDVETLYNVARDTMIKRQYKLAAGMFDEVERQHPYSVWARRAQLMSAYNYYVGRQYNEAIQSSQRFLSLHPGSREAPYAYYIVAVSYYEQISDVEHDQKITQQALDAMGELIRRYPGTDYAADAKLKIDLTRDHLAGKEMEIGRFYQKNRQYLAAVLRFRTVVEKYDTTSHIPEALHRLVECYLSLGIPEEANKAAAVLGYNYPGSEWYDRSFKLIGKKSIPPQPAAPAKAS